MKKILLLFLTIASVASANAQIQFGLKAGANFCMVSGKGTTGTKYMTYTGYYGGALVAIPVVGQFSLQPELVYSAEGANIEGDGNFTLNSAYFNIPVMIKYNHPSGFFLETGPQLGFLLSAKVKSGSFNEDVKSSSQSTSFSWAFGLGYLILPVNLGIDARYNLGLTNLANNGNYLSNIKDNVIQIGLFYVFGKGPYNK
jgi:Outer membrane protein beta-barrel domain